MIVCCFTHDHHDHHETANRFTYVMWSGVDGGSYVCIMHAWNQRYFGPTILGRQDFDSVCLLVTHDRPTISARVRKWCTPSIPHMRHHVNGRVCVCVWKIQNTTHADTIDSIPLFWNDVTQRASVARGRVIYFRFWFYGKFRCAIAGGHPLPYHIWQQCANDFAWIVSQYSCVMMIWGFVMKQRDSVCGKEWYMWSVVLIASALIQLKLREVVNAWAVSTN